MHIESKCLFETVRSDDTISEMANLEVPVQTDHSHGDEAPAAKEEARPAIETTALPTKQPPVGQTRYYEKWLSCHCGDRDGEGWGMRKRRM